MIPLNLETLNDVSDLLLEYSKFIEKKLGIPSFPVKERFITSIKERNNEILALYDNRHNPVGIVRTAKEKASSNEIYINAFYYTEKAEDHERLEINFFDTAFNRLKNDHTVIRVAGIPLTASLRNHIIASNFLQFDRSKMSITKSIVDSLPTPNLSEGYTFTKWHDKFTEQMIELMVKYNYQSVDNDLFPYFKDVDAVKEFIKDLTENRWGKFESELTIALKHNDKIIGVCFFTILDNGNGYIPELGILKPYQGQGLGKKLVLQGLKHFVTNQESKEIILDVTLKNIVAFNLYQSLGFKSTSEYSVFVWKGDNHA
jgi:ribosomal protein S18 acetylase RimI-like enzyme